MRFTALLMLMALGVNVMAIEEAAYNVVKEDGDFEVRQYEPQIVAEVVVEADMADAGNRAFRKLFRYISGDNRAQKEISMTSPVSQAPRSEKIEMTAPVSQQPAGESWAVNFLMPAFYTMETIPEPLDPDVVIREIPARSMAVIRYSGTWSEERYGEHLKKLIQWIQKNEIETIGEPVWARYNPPFMPWFLRRNEILIPIRQFSAEPLQGSPE